MNAVLTRESSTDQGTFGRFLLDNGMAWHSLELPWRDNAPLVSCIPAGKYDAVLKPSPKHHCDLYHLEGTAPRQAIEIHAANWAGDTLQGWHSDLLGCIALGKSIGNLTPSEGRSQAALIESKKAIQEFMAATAGQPITIEIIDQQGTNDGNSGEGGNP